MSLGGRGPVVVGRHGGGGQRRGRRRRRRHLLESPMIAGCWLFCLRRRGGRRSAFELRQRHGGTSGRKWKGAIYAPRRGGGRATRMRAGDGGDGRGCAGAASRTHPPLVAERLILAQRVRRGPPVVGGDSLRWRRQAVPSGWHHNGECPLKEARAIIAAALAARSALSARSSKTSTWAVPSRPSLGVPPLYFL